MSIKRFKIILSLLACLSIKNITSYSKLETNAWIEKERAKVNKLIFDNGLTVLHYYKGDTPEVILLMNIKVGSKDEKPHQSGFAHLLEHMVFKGTNEGEESLSETDVEAIAEKYCVGHIGEGFNAFTRYDNTSYFFNTDKNNWPIFLKIFKGWLLHAKLDPEHFASEIKTVYEEFKDRGMNPICKGFSLTLPSTHPYFNPIIGNKETILKSTVEDLRKFYKEHYIPEKTAIIIAGNVKKEDVIKNISKTFKINLKSQEINTDIKTPSAPFYTGFFQNSFTNYSTYPYFQTTLIWPLPGIHHINKHALFIISHILSERLDRKLKDELQYVKYIYSSLTVQELQNIFFISYEIKNENINSVNINEECKKAILEEIVKLQQEGFEEKELEICKKGIMRSNLIKFEDLHAICFELADNYQANYSLQDLFSDPEKFSNLTLNDLQDVVKKYLRSIYMNEIKIVPLPKEEISNWEKLQEQLDSNDKKLLSKFKREKPVEAPSYANKLAAPKLLNFEFEAPSRILTLSNGMKVFLKKRDNVPFIALRMEWHNSRKLFRSLALENKEINYNMAYEHLLSGSKDHSKKEIEDFLNEYGVIGDATNFYCIKTHFETVAEKFVDLILNTEFPEKYLSESISSRIDSISKNLQTPWGIAYEIFSNIFHKKYPWIKSSQEYLELLKSCKREDILNLHKQFVSNPENIFLVVVGDFDEDAIEESLEKIFSKWKNNGYINFREIEIPHLSNPEPQTITEYFPSERVSLLLGKITVSPYSKEWFTLLILEDLLNKKLFNIREKMGIFYSCSAQLTHRHYEELKDYATIRAQVSLQNLEIAKEEINNALLSFITNEISEEELITRKQNFLTQFAKSFTTNQAITNSYARLISRNKEWNFFNEFLNNIYSITKEDIKTVAEKHLNPNDWTVIQVGRIKNMPK